MSDLMGLNIDELCPIQTYSCNLGRIHFPAAPAETHAPRRHAAGHRLRECRVGTKVGEDVHRRRKARDFRAWPREPAAVRLLDVALA
ncbi:hypothetical protein KDW61_12260 [Burkholderia cenocepacia]|uniref:hypothetical protein n=1 Tax=Burkholderia TaxID=32008 RepID=UPI00158D887C|nr:MULTISPECIES: hypothetical protein [Burkholderia]MBR8209436.1 hypothetical protein [Burkholderia cenocepacia]